MAVSYGPKLGLLINALTGDVHDAALRALLRALDQEMFLAVINRTTTAPPGSPANGDAYIVATGGSGAWSGHDKHVAVWTTDNPATPSGLWEFYVPKAGWLAYSVADAGFYAYSGSAWAVLAGGGGGGTLAGDSDVNIPSPANNDVLTYSSGTSKWISAAPSGGGGGGVAFQSQQKRTVIFGYKQGSPAELGNITGPRADGDVILLTAGTLAAATSGSTNGAGTTLATTGTGAGASIVGDTIYRTGRALKILGKIWLSRTTDTRFIFGVAGGANDSDAPFDFTAFFRFSTIAGDTNFQCVTGDASAVTVTDSGVAADTSEHTFAMIFDDAAPNVKFYIDGSLVGTNTTHLPGSGHNLCYALLIRGNSTNNTVGFGQIIIDSDF
jgi:hypothetical protein